MVPACSTGHVPLKGRENLWPHLPVQVAWRLQTAGRNGRDSDDSQNVSETCVVFQSYSLQSM